MASRGLLRNRPQTITSYAGFVSRLVAFVIDLMIVTAVVTIVTALSRWFGSTLGLGELTQTFLLVVTLLFDGAFILVYYVGFLAMAGQTPGKWTMGVRVIMMSGERVTVRRSARRFLGYFLSLPLFWGYLIVLIDDGRRAFHDRFAGTRVVYDR